VTPHDQSRVYSGAADADHRDMEHRDLPRVRRMTIALVGLTLLAAAGSAAPVSAASPGLRIAKKSGACTQSASWTLVVKRVTQGLQVAFTISKGPAGDRWTIFMDDNGSGFYADSRVASKRGIAKVTVVIPDLSGPDTISAAASDRRTGETCDGRVRL
jgi:hypothetical protein